METAEKVDAFRVETRVESDHQPITVLLRTEQEAAEEEEGEEEKEVPDRSEESIRMYREELERSEYTRGTVEIQTEGLVQLVKAATVMKRKGRRKKLGENRWWRRACKEKKREVRKALREWRKGKMTKERYCEKRKEYKDLCKEMKRRKQEEYEDEIRGINTEQQAWRYINQERKRRVGVSKKIGMEDWREHFMTILNGEEERTVVEAGQKDEEEESEDTTGEMTISDAEVGRQIRRLKKKRAPGEDGIQNEAWIYCTQEANKQLGNLIRKIWNGEGFPSRWREGIISPIYKKGERDKVKNYKGGTLLNTLYKVYAMTLEERLNEKADEKGIIPETQAGFRKGRSSMDNIYILNHLVGEEIAKERGKMYALFIDLRAAFDTVNREKLWKAMEKRRVSEQMIRIIKEIYEETSNVVKVNRKTTRSF